MKRILPWLFLVVISVNRLSAQTKSTRVSSGPSPQMDASQSPTDRTEPGKVKWTAGPETMPGNIQAFQEYKGQFLNLANNWKILYGADYQGAKILFTDHGVIYTLVEKVANSDKDEDEGDKGKSAEEKNKERQSLKKNVYHNVAIEWENVNAGLTVEAQDETPYYFGSVDPSHAGQAIDNIKGFKKLVYHNVYPGIDVEFTFHKNRGIKYAVIVHPGYNASDFKMLYNGENEQLSIDENGNVHMPTAIGDLIDHAPISFQNGQKVESSFKKLSDNEVAFQLGKYDPNTDLVIDPWTVTALGTNFLPGDVGMDAANNVYIYGAGTDNYVQKYTAAGALSWTYTLTQYGTFSGYISDMAVDQAGNTYIPGPYPYTNGAGGDYTMLSLKPAGTLRYFNNTSPINSGSAAPNEIFEVWNVAYSCDFSELVEGGSPTVEQEDVGVVNSANGNVGGLTVKTTYGEIYAGTMAPNGNYYAIAANPCFGCSTPGDDIVCYTIAAGTATFSWNKQSVYQWNDFDTKNPDGIATNGIGASCAYLYTSDGKTLDQRSLTNGTVINTKTIPGGTNTDPSPSGIGVDLACGYVYAGTPTTVQVYDQNLNAITSQATPAEVRDVCYNNGLVAACGGASSSSSDFVMVFTGQLCTTELTITHVNTSCGLNNGSATVATPTFCTGPYTYLWTPTGQTTQTATGLSAGVYTVNVGTSTSCVTVSDTVTIKPSTAETVTATATSGCTGSVSITVTGGVAPYTYSWSSGQTTSNITGVSAGSYTITVTDNSGCVRTATATVTGITLTITPTQVNELCNGGSTGSASVTATGGTAPYTYAWSNGKTSSNITGLSAGTYNVTVTESGGCTGTSSVTITQPTAITTTSSSTPAACTAPTGTASITAAGGTPGYTYSWSTGATTSNITALSGGTYVVTVKDANGCTIVTNVIVAGSSVPITATTTPTNILCNGGTGSATVTAPAGGTAPYTYLWSNSQTTTTASPLSAGTYNVTVTDANGCSGTETVTITQPAALTATAANTPALCNAGNGTATVTAGGGTPGYTYSWSNGATTSTINATAGSYTATVKDANGCTITATTTITQPTAVTATTTNTPPLCNGGNGTATVTAGGGTPGYTYSWSNAATTSTITATAGTYVATVKDANGCTITSTTTITQPTAITATASNTPPLCNGGNGTATVTAGGGTPGYTYSWSNAATSSTMTATAGTYTATVTDANGCTITANTTIVQPTALTTTPSSTPSNCTASTGTATITPAGGTPGYSYSWNGGQTTSSINSLSAGTYTVIVTDANSCTITTNVIVANTGATITPTITSTNVLCNGGNTGAASVTATGGTTPYTYLWSSAQTSSNITALTAGSYSVTVTDANGCSGTASVIITQPAQLRDSIVNSVNEPCFGNSLGSITTGEKGGTLPYGYSWSSGQITQNITNVTAGSYTITVTDGNGCVVTANATITQPTAITMTAAGFPTSCFGSCDGQVAVIPSGGTTPYTYLWTPSGNTNASQPGMCAGTDSVYVTDANGCKADTAVIVNQPAAIDDSIVTTVNVLCNGGNNGSATVGVKGGTAPYTYSWTSAAGTNATATGLTAGSYTCTVTDKDLCSNTVVATITEPPVLVATLPAPSTLCIGQSVTITATVIGGTPTYTYSWSNGATTSSITASPVVTTSYSVTVTDANGCIVGPISITITVNPPLAVIAGPTKSICPGGTTTISATASGGDGTYTYVWTPGGMNGSSVNVSPGTTTTYTVTVNDGCGTPAVTATEAVIVDPLPVVSFTADTTNGCYPLCINFKDMTTIASGGVDQWQWTFGNGGTSSHADTTFCYMTPGVYTVGLTVTSDSGCSSSQTVPNMITVYNHPTAMFTSSPQPATIIEPTVTFTDQSTDDYGIVKWQWLFGDPLDGNSNLQNPSYTYADTGTYCPHLTVTNKYGCVDSITQCIVIEPFFTLYIPNAFSPNGDGVNDIFTAKGTYVCEFQMYIFDRWGMQLFYTEDMNRGWDGTVNGGQNVEQEDTYVYLIYAVDCIEHKKHSYIGKVSIVK